MNRVKYEKRVVRTMIGIYCKAHHLWLDGLCEECETLARYYELRVERCPLGDNKTSCKLCTIHCSERHHQERIRQVMRYAGPRMIFRHPMMALRHLYYEKIRDCFKPKNR